MNKRHSLAPFIIIPLLALLIVSIFLGTHDIALLNPQGLIAQKQFDLLVFASILSLIVLVPVFALTFFIVWRYREGNTKAKYSPDWDSSRILETIWWTVPLALILVLSVVTWSSSHELDPSKPLASTTKPVTIQVVALEWKWLFIYPEEQIATVNYVKFPMSTPVNFNITADAPMNSFWIPSLGGQIYAMSGMSTKLHLEADGAGKYKGSSANISGRGFAGMNFVAESTSQDDYKTWVRSAQEYGDSLTTADYDQLAKPSQNNKPQTFSYVSPNLYNDVLMKYMLPAGQISRTEP
ncbi:MAG: ubiquinol oxidase subunit II [Patescibacteria group bacterium]|mgnify:CR=1 FL=1